MQALGDPAILQLWEQGRTRHPIDRALLLFAAAAPELARESLADFPIGRRDAAILDLRNASFGPGIDGYGNCPRCGERFEFALDGQALRAAASPAARAQVVDDDGREFRLPTSRDLAAIAHLGADDAAQQLARACIGGSAEPEDVQRLARLDPAADLELAMRCESCGHDWSLAFDPATYCWEEIEARAARLFDQVHTLARAYGWTEPEVLRLTPPRRAAYLERCGA